MIPTLHTPYKSTIINSYIISRCIYVYDMCVLKYAITYVYLHIHVYMFTYKICMYVYVEHETGESIETGRFASI